MKLLIVYSLVLITLVFNLTGCGQKDEAVVPPSQINPCPPSTTPMKDTIVASSLDGIQKQGLWGNCMPESSVVVMNNKLLMVSFANGFDAPKGIDGVIVYDFFTKEIIASHEGAALYGSAFVKNDTLYVFTSAFNYVTMTSTTNLHDWTPWVKVWTVTDDLALSLPATVFNTSVTEGPDGFVMAYETALSQPSAGYTWKVAISQDLIHWQPIGTAFSDNYSACPVVRYANGYYQFIYLVGSEGPQFVSKVARTKDFINYEVSNTIFLAPSKGDGRNNSDVDLIEFNGQVYIIYINGTQGDPDGWSGNMWAIYPGTMEDMFTKVWE